jgi:hypothetical protein
VDDFLTLARFGVALRDAFGVVFREREIVVCFFLLVVVFLGEARRLGR